MNKKTLLCRMPVETRSGYGEWGRQLLYSIVNSQYAPEWDINLWSCPWGHTPATALEETGVIEDCIKELLKKPPLVVNPDAFLTLTIPDEFQRIGSKVTVGITAGAECDRISMPWIEKINAQTDIVFAISDWMAQMMRGTFYQQQRENSNEVVREIRVNKTIDVWNPVVDTKTFNPNVKCNLDLNITTRLNFLYVGAWLKGDYSKDRKNLGVLVRTFLQTFLGRTDVGLIIKTSGAHQSLLDRVDIERKIEAIKNTMVNNPTKLCLPKVYLIHGDMTKQELAQLYNHPSIIAYVSPHHGEGWGMPITEAMACNVPVIVTPWSGNMDFYKDGCALPLKIELKEIPEDCVWDNIFVKGCKWAEVDEQVLSNAMMWSTENPVDLRKIGVAGGKYIRDNFNMTTLQEQTDTILQKLSAAVENKLDTSTIPFTEL